MIKFLRFLLSAYRRWRDKRLFMKIYFIRLKYQKDDYAFYSAQKELKLIKAKWSKDVKSPATTLVSIR